MSKDLEEKEQSLSLRSPSFMSQSFLESEITETHEGLFIK